MVIVTNGVFIPDRLVGGGHLKADEIQVNVTYTEGYEERFTKCCLSKLRMREEKASRCTKQETENPAA